MEAIDRYITSNDLLTLLILLVLLLLVLAKLIFGNRLQDFLSLFGSGSFLIIKSREHKSLFGFNVLMLIVHILCASIFLFIIYRFFADSPLQEPGIILLRITTAYAFFILLKGTLEKMIANIFDIDEITDFYLFQKHSYRNLVSLYFLPAAVLSIYTVELSRELLYITGGLFGVVLLLGFLQVIKKNQGLITRHWFYFILYLCALEITPYIILYKLITDGKVT